MKLKILALITALFLFAGCAAGISPAPGINIGFNARPDAVGVEFDVNPISAGCSLSKLVSWKWAEDQVCPMVEAPQIPHLDENVEAAPKVGGTATDA